MKKKTITRRMAAVLGAILLLTACANPAGKADVTLEKRQAEADKLDARIVNANNDFGLQMHRMLAEEEKGAKNIFLSPTSIALALSMTYNGSKGETQSEMARTLGLADLSSEEINRGNKTLQSLLSKAGAGVEVDIANSLWSRKGKSFQSEFLKTNKTYYHAKIAELDFNSPVAVKTMNAWVDKSTRGKIAKMVDSIDPREVLILMNAVYFKGGWQKEFQPSATAEDSFTLRGGTVKKVQMMSQTGTYDYLQEPGFQAIRLPYGSGQMDMLVIVPDKSSTLDALHERIWADPGHWRKPFGQHAGEIRLPRFKIEYKADLAKSLEALGMKLAFDENRADFSGMAPVPPNLFISEVQHKTFVEVNEKGTEAAAVTSVRMKASSAEPPPDRFRMSVDRPFFFAIEDRQTGAWLFEGSVVEP